MSLDTISDVATVLTAILASAFWGQFQWERRRKRLRLERHLRGNPDPHGNAVPIPDLVWQVGMTQAEILDAAFRSAHIERGPALDRGLGATVALRFKHPPPQRF